MKKALLATLIVLTLGVAISWLWLTREQVPFYKSVETPPAPVLTPQQALQSFELAPGFAIELVAAEPLVVDPVAMSWDESGRLFVVEMRGFMPDADGNGEDQPVGRVVMLLDDDGDGAMDRSEVFLDGLVMPRAVAVVNEGLLVAEPPVLWLCPDIQGKVRCDNKRKVANYATNHDQVSMEHLENGLLLALDNWIYNAKSDRRFRFMAGELVEEKTLSRGQWGISQDNSGRLYYNTNSNFLSGDYFPASDQHGLSKGVGEAIAHNDEVFSTRVNTGVNRAYIEGVLRDDGRLKAPTAVSGLAVYRGGQFPQEYRNDIFVPEPAANAVVQLRTNGDEFEVRAEHVTYPDETWGRKEFLTSSDERFRPVDAGIGPDGALYLIDMYRGIIQHKDFLTPQLREQILERGLDKPLGQGRIWRIVHSDTRRLDTLQLTQSDNDELIAALAHPVPWVRDTAQRLLAVRPGVTPALQDYLQENDDELASIHALWVLEARKALDADAVARVLARQNAVLATQALRAGGELLPEVELLRQQAYVQEAGHLPLYIAWLAALATHAQSPAVQLVLVDTLQINYQSVYVREAALRAARGQEFALLQQLLASEALQPSAGWQAVLSDLSRSFYRGQAALSKGSAADDEAAHQWLGLVLAQRGEHQWRQLALLDGLARAASSGLPILELAVAPTIFTDKTLTENDPLWAARLSARRGFTWPGDELASGLQPLTGEQTRLLAKGKHFYRHCAACHGPDGDGVPGLAPELSGSVWVTGPVEWLTRIVLDGMSGPIDVNGKTWNGVMPGHRQFADLDDETLTGLLIYLRRMGANRAPAPSLDRVASIRSLPARTAPWTAKAIRQVPYTTPLDRYAGKYKISFITFTFSVEQGELQVSAPMYGSAPLEQIDANSFSVSQGGEVLLFRFEEDAQGEVNELVLVRGGQEHRIEKSL